ncbi:MAG: gliding motility-associated C-terminal domain-containing protein [Prevotella sp.]|nr:gliding motility-associated C-terminal domain-containing protein [Prevotella sp.]MDY4217478.1 gliding motility-associated C-terminal domain-containing protein [Prevotella sp.]
MRKIVLLVLLCVAFTLNAQTFSPYGAYITSEGTPDTLSASQGFMGSAPLTVMFRSNPLTTYDAATQLEWHFFDQRNNSKVAFLIRYDEDTEYTFTTAGTFRIVLYEILKGDTVAIYDPISVSISESELLMPNAFSPNGDGINDVYKAKSGFKSIVEFHAVVFNRWGQKLYEWNDPSGGWDGTFRGRDVAPGVYFVNVKARGADGREFRIKKDINLLRTYSETTTVQP